MADYNSPYTGAEIDAGILKLEDMPYYEELYLGAPTDAGIALDSLAVNPSTGDRTGLYNIVVSDNATDITSTGVKNNVSVLYIAAEIAASTGTSAVGMTGTSIMASKAKFNLSGDGKLHAYYYTHTFGSGVAIESPLFIHRVVRIQKGV